MKITKRSIVSLLVGIASVVLIVAGLRAMSGVLNPILLAFFIVLVTSPIMAWLKERGFPGWLAYILVLLLVLGLGAFFILFFVVSLGQLADALPNYASQIEAELNSLWQWLNEQGIDADTIQDLQLLQPGRILQLSLSFVSALLGIVSKVGLALFVYIYMLAAASSFSKHLRRGLRDNPRLLGQFRDFARSMSTYLLTKSWLGAAVAICQIVLMWVMNIDLAVLWGVLSFFFSFVPNIGLYIALAPPLLIALVKLGVGQAVIFFVIYLTLNNIFDSILAPRYLGKGLDLSVVVPFLSVVIWTWILGPIGAFLGLPLTVMVKKLVLETFPQTQLLASLLGSGDEDQTDKEAEG